MAVAQVSLVSAVRAAPAARATRASSKARAVKVVAKAGVERVELAKKASAVAVSVGAAMSGAEAKAAEIVAAAPQEVFATAEGVPTPVLYFGFLIASFGVAVGTYIALSKVKLI